MLPGKAKPQFIVHWKLQILFALCKKRDEALGVVNYSFLLLKLKLNIPFADNITESIWDWIEMALEQELCFFIITYPSNYR